MGEGAGGDSEGQRQLQAALLRTLLARALRRETKDHRPYPRGEASASEGHRKTVGDEPLTMEGGGWRHADCSQDRRGAGSQGPAQSGIANPVSLPCLPSPRSVPCLPHPMSRVPPMSAHPMSYVFPMSLPCPSRVCPIPCPSPPRGRLPVGTFLAPALTLLPIRPVHAAPSLTIHTRGPLSPSVTLALTGPLPKQPPQTSAALCTSSLQ